MRLGMAESGCLVALKSLRVHHYVSVNSLSQSTIEAACWGLDLNMTKKGMMPRMTSVTMWTAVYLSVVLVNHWSVFYCLDLSIISNRCFQLFFPFVFYLYFPPAKLECSTACHYTFGLMWNKEKTLVECKVCVHSSRYLYFFACRSH